MKQDQTSKSNKKTGKAARIFRTLGIILLCLVLALYVLFPVTMGAIAAMRSAQKAEPPPDGFEAVTLTVGDGTALACWFTPGENGAAIITGKSNLASLTQQRCYTMRVTAFCANPARAWRQRRRGNAFGWQCGRDVAAAVDYLPVQGVDQIGALGLSMGSEVLLDSAADEPAIKAVVADGASQRSLADYLVPESNRSLWRSWTTRVMYASVRLTGQTPPERTLLSSILDAKDTRFLFIAAGNVEKEPLFGEIYHDAVPERSALWIVRNGAHAGADDRAGRVCFASSRFSTRHCVSE
ncbi:MAG: hypothetical protein R2912_03360 [Eubacteriales bacterium]